MCVRHRSLKCSCNMGGQGCLRKLFIYVYPKPEPSFYKECTLFAELPDLIEKIVSGFLERGENIKTFFLVSMFTATACVILKVIQFAMPSFHHDENEVNFGLSGQFFEHIFLY